MGEDERMDQDVQASATLTDSYQRRIDYLRISITDRCDLKCRYCMPDGKARPLRQSDLLTMDEISRIVRLVHAHGLKKVRLTGGEPLLRNDLLPLVSILKQQIGIHDLSLTTNGLRLAEIAGPLKSAGLDRVNISLDSMDPGRFRTITGGGDIGRVWEAIAAAEEAGLYPIKINMVPMRGLNDDELVRFAELTLRKDYHVRFIERMPVGRRGRALNDGVPKEEMMRSVATLGRLLPLEFRGRGPSRNYRIEGARGVIGFISAMTDHFCAGCNRLRLTAAGKLRPCLFSEIEADLKIPMRNKASDDELKGLLDRVVAAKPGGHALHRPEAGHSLTSMSQIGG